MTPPPDTQKPTVPTGLTATAGPITEIDLAWSASTDTGGHVAGYKLSRDGTVIATTYSVSYKDTGVAAGSHTYTVSAFDGANNTSDPSTGATATATAALPGAVTYTYDLADRLISIAAPSGSTTSFTLDALGRHASQTITGSPVSSYAYLGTTDIVVAISSNSTTTLSAIDALGSRVATSSGATFGYLLGDLHGNQAAAFNAAGTAVSDAFAYDAWGVVVASVTSALPTPWRYGGRMLESAAGTPDLYDFQARSYNPALGTFTSLDSHLGSAQNTALLNGYLYANANPATLVDPDGHGSMSDDIYAFQHPAEAAGLTGSGDMSRDVHDWQHRLTGSGDMSRDVYNQTHDTTSAAYQQQLAAQQQKEANVRAQQDSSTSGPAAASDPTAGMTDDQIAARMKEDFQNSGGPTDPAKLDSSNPDSWGDLTDQLYGAGANTADYYHAFWVASYDQTYKAMMARGASVPQARQAAENLANINVGKTSGDFADKLGTGFSYAAMIWDGARAISTCTSKDWKECAASAAITIGKDYAIYKIAATIEASCLAGEWAGPEGCFGLAATVGVALNPDFWSWTASLLPYSEECEKDDLFGPDYWQSIQKPSPCGL